MGVTWTLSAHRVGGRDDDLASARGRREDFHGGEARLGPASPMGTLMMRIQGPLIATHRRLPCVARGALYRCRDSRSGLADSSLRRSGIGALATRGRSDLRSRASPDARPRPHHRVSGEDLRVRCDGVRDDDWANWRMRGCSAAGKTSSARLDRGMLTRVSAVSGHRERRRRTTHRTMLATPTRPTLSP